VVEEKASRIEAYGGFRTVWKGKVGKISGHGQGGGREEGGPDVIQLEKMHSLRLAKEDERLKKKQREKKKTEIF